MQLISVKILLQNFDPLTIYSLPCIGKKVKINQRESDNDLFEVYAFFRN